MRTLSKAALRWKLGSGLVAAAIVVTACQPTVTLMPAVPVLNAVAPAAPGGEVTCDLPEANEDFERRSPAELGVDPEILSWALNAADHPLTASMRVYRRGCLIASAGPTGYASDGQTPLFSMTKSIVAMGVGRAVTLGLMRVDDPLGKYFANLDAAHAKITIRDLMQQTSGLRFAWANDLAGSLEDSVDQALSMPIVHEPGEHFEYAQTTVNVVAAAVGRAVGMDFQAFMSAELFEPIGIEPGTWTWMRDGAGNTQGYAWLDMEPRDVARLSMLMLHNGVWDGVRLLDAGYLEEMTTGTKANPGYGYFTAVNDGEFFIEHFGQRRFEGEHLTSAPADLIHFSGFLDQDSFIVPSLDLVVVRNGLPMDSRWRWIFFKRLMPAFPDVAAVDPQAPQPMPLEVHIVWEQVFDVETLIRRLSTNQRTVR